jgi:hypothetical protein
LLALAGCGGEPEPRPAPADGPRAIRAEVGDAFTRASRIETADRITSLGIFGYSTGTADFDPANTTHRPNLIYNQKAARADAASPWIYSPVAYWSTDRTIKNTFVAYSPHTGDFPDPRSVAVSLATASGWPTLNYNVPVQVNRQVDLLYSDPVPDINAETHAGAVPYVMHHALSWLRLLIAPQKAASDGESYTLTSLEFSARDMVTSAQLNLGTGEWVPLIHDDARYSFVVTGNAVQVGKVAPAAEGANYLMTIPQELDQEINSPMLDVTFTYFDGVTLDPDDYFFSVPFPADGYSFRQSMVTVYIIKLNTEGVAIQFDSENSIEDWVEDPSDPTVVDVY